VNSIVFSVLNGELVAFDPVHEGFHHLNPSASLVWGCVDGLRDVRSIVYQVIQVAAPSTTEGQVGEPGKNVDAGTEAETDLALGAEIAIEVKRTLIKLARRGLIADPREEGDRPSSSAVAPVDVAANLDETLWGAAACIKSNPTTLLRTLEIAQRTISVSTNVDEVHRDLPSLIEAIPYAAVLSANDVLLDEPHVQPRDLSVEPSADRASGDDSILVFDAGSDQPRRYRIQVNARRRWWSSELETLCSNVASELNQLVVDQACGYLRFHAGAVE